MTKDKPLKMFPIVLFGLLIGSLLTTSFNYSLIGLPLGIYLGCLIIYRHNVKKFGKRYWKKSYA